MDFFWQYTTPGNFSNLILKSDGTVLTGLYFIDDISVQEMVRQKMNMQNWDCFLESFRQTTSWLDCYFQGECPNWLPAYRLEGVTPFRQSVVELMMEIPWGQQRSYSQLAQAIAQKQGVAKMSAQAIGGAVGWNPICIIIPCHRVLGSRGQLVGYRGGIENKLALLRHEEGAVCKACSWEKETCYRCP